MEFLLTLVTEYEREVSMEHVQSELREQIDLARKGGFDAVRVGEHHATEEKQYLLNEAVLAFAAGQSENIGVATGLCLLPYHNPVRIAELGATLDILTQGEFRLGVGQGYRDEEFQIFGLDRKTKARRLAEGVEIIKRLWTEDGVSFDGEFHQLEDVTINPKPLQSPRPPIWVGATSERSVRRAARIGDGWWGAFHRLNEIQNLAGIFRDERDDEAGTIGVSREVIVAESNDAAEAAVKRPLVRKYDAYTDWGQEGLPSDESLDEAWQELRRDRFIVGDPSTVAAELKRYEEIGLDFMAVRMHTPGMPYRETKNSIELFSREVLPHL